MLPVVCLLITGSLAAPKPHIIVLGPRRVVKTSDLPARTLNIRRLFIDGRSKEYTTGPAHEVTDRLFVIERAVRLNDSLPNEPGKTPRWTWQADGWISVDRSTGHIAQLVLPAYDPLVSEPSWYRDYAAYCGASDDGSKVYMIVSQLGTRKPVVKKAYVGQSCPAPRWERGPTRVTFSPADGPTVTFAVQGRSADRQDNAAEEEVPQ